MIEPMIQGFLVNLFSQATYDIADKGWSFIKEHLLKTETNEPMIILLSRVRDCYIEELKKCKMIKNPSQLYDKAVSILIKRNKKLNKNWQKYDYHTFLPMFEPIAQIKDLVEFLLQKQIISEHDRNKFHKNINLKIEKLSSDKKLSETLRLLSLNQDYKESTRYLLKLYELRNHRLTPEDPPLHAIYISTRGQLLSADTWGENPKLWGNHHDVEKLINQYFTKRDKYPRSKQILFIGAEFGVGKTSYLQMKASNMANEYLKTRKGLYPIYLSLKLCDGDPARIRSELSDYIPPSGHPVCLLLDALDESGPVTNEYIKTIIRAVEDLMSELPKLSRCIITSRLILGTNGAVAGHIKAVLQYGVAKEQTEPNYILIKGFTTSKHVDQWIRKQRMYRPDIWGKNICFADMARLGLNDEELQKPLYYWIISQLAMNKIIIVGEKMLMGRTGLYMHFIQFVSSKCKTKYEQSEDSNTTYKARHLLRRIAVIRNIMQDDNGLSHDHVKNCLNKKSCEAKFYKELGEAEFLAMSYFGQRRHNFEFSHLSFREYLLAEDIISSILFASVSDHGSLEKHRFCVGPISEATQSFIHDMTFGLIGCSKFKQYVNFFSPFLASCSIASSSFSNSRNSIKKLIQDTVQMMAHWVADERPSLIEPPGESEKSITHFGQKILSYSKPINFKELYQERWLALLVGKSLQYALEQEKDFLNEHSEIIGSSLCSLINSSHKGFYSWQLELLNNSNLDNITAKHCNITGANLSNATLRNANFAHSDLSYADFTGADLTNANFEQANLSYTTFDNTTVKRANFTGACFRGSTIRNTDFNGSTLSYADFRDSMMRHVVLAGSQCNNMVMNNSPKYYIDVELDGRFSIHALITPS